MSYDTRHRVNLWRRCMGLCCICGQIMASPQSSLLMMVENTTATVDENDLNDDAPQQGIDTDGRLLTEENSIRLTLLRYNALADMQFAHIIDDYTFLEGKRNAPKDHSVFKTELRTHFARVRAANPAALDRLWRQIFASEPPSLSSFVAPPKNNKNKHHHLRFANNNNNKKADDAEAAEQQEEGGSRLYERAVSTQKRVVDNLTVPSCKRCNKAMDRIYSHVLAAYRCFSLTRDSDVPQLEGREATTLMAGRLLQQIALYFSPPTHDGDKEGWTPKTEHALLSDANVWRCIAHLWNWGQSPLGGGIRFRMVATFHASHFVYLNGRMRGVMPFETWHVHVWRPFLMDTFPRANTFLGIEQAEVARRFDLDTSKRGAEWDTELRERLMRIVVRLDTHADDEDLVQRVVRFEQALTKASVVDEASLVIHLRRRYEGETRRSLDVLLEFFRYNLSDSGASAVMLRRCRTLTDELERATLRHCTAASRRTPPCHHEDRSAHR